MRVQEIFGFSAIAALAAAAIFSSFPLWKSATVSPDAIQRRVWWTCCAIAAVSVLLWQLPNWGQGVFAAILLAVALFFVAGRWTTFIKINGRVFSASPRSDRPPALAPADDE